MADFKFKTGDKVRFFMHEQCAEGAFFRTEGILFVGKRYRSGIGNEYTLSSCKDYEAKLSHYWKTSDGDPELEMRQWHNAVYSVPEENLTLVY